MTPSTLQVQSFQAHNSLSQLIITRLVLLRHARLRFFLMHFLYPIRAHAKARNPRSTTRSTPTPRRMIPNTPHMHIIRRRRPRDNLRLNLPQPLQNIPRRRPPARFLLQTIQTQPHKPRGTPRTHQPLHLFPINPKTRRRPPKHRLARQPPARNLTKNHAEGKNIRR